MKTSADWLIEINDMADTCQAIIDTAEASDLEMSDEQNTSVNELMASMTQAKAKREQTLQVESTKRELAAARMQQHVPAKPATGALVPSDVRVIQHHPGKMRAFAGPEGHRDAYDCGMWLRALVARNRRGVDEVAESQIAKRGWNINATVGVEGTPGLGGYLVPTPLANSIIYVRALAGISRQVSRVMPMTSETLEVAKKLTGLTVYYPGEATAITESNQTWGNVLLTSVKRAILSKVSQELTDDAIIGVMDDLANQMGVDFAVQEDNEFINGDGTAGTYGSVNGLLDVLGTSGLFTAPVGESTWSLLTIDSFVDTMALLPDRFMQYSPSWICSSQFYYSVMLRLLTAAGGNTIGILEGGAASRPTFLGFPVYLTNQMPTATGVSTVSALFGAYNQAAIIGDRLGIQIAQSEHLGFAEDTLAIRATSRYDIQVHEGGDDVSTPGAYTGLATAAT